MPCHKAMFDHILKNTVITYFQCLLFKQLKKYIRDMRHEEKNLNNISGHICRNRVIYKLMLFVWTYSVGSCCMATETNHHKLIYTVYNCNSYHKLHLSCTEIGWIPSHCQPNVYCVLNLLCIQQEVDILSAFDN